MGAVATIGDCASVLATLSVSYAAAGRASEAAAVAAEALRRAEAAGQTELAARIRARLQEGQDGAEPREELR